MIQGEPNPAIKNQHQGTEETLDTQSGAKRSCSILHKFGVDVSVNLGVSRAQVKGQQPALEPTFPLERVEAASGFMETDATLLKCKVDSWRALEKVLGFMLTQCSRALPGQGRRTRRESEEQEPWSW